MYVAIITSHLLILDEPTNHLDQEIKKKYWQKQLKIILVVLF